MPDLGWERHYSAQEAAAEGEFLYGLLEDLEVFAADHAAENLQLALNADAVRRDILALPGWRAEGLDSCPGSGWGWAWSPRWAAPCCPACGLTSLHMPQPCRPKTENQRGIGEVPDHPAIRGESGT